MPKPILWIVIPCYNEEAVLPITAPLFLQKINDLAARGLVSDRSRVLFVNDGSKDKTWELIQGFAKQDEHFIGIAQSRNRGHQNAVLAGLMEALHSGSCDITISIDCDGQDDINAMDEMVQKYLDGAEVVYGVRSRRDTDTFFKRFTAEGFYHVMNALGADIVFNHADYRLISTRVLESFADYHEVNIFLRGMVPLVGFPHDVVTYERHERLAGESHYPLSKMLALAFDGITSLSNKPIRIITGAGIVVSLIGFIGVIWAIVQAILGSSVAGWASIVCIVCFMGGVQLVCLGVIGEYIGKIYMETKARPRYIISERTWAPYERKYHPAEPGTAGAGVLRRAGPPQPHHHRLDGHHLHTAQHGEHQRAAGTVQPPPHSGERAVCHQPAHRSTGAVGGLVRREERPRCGQVCRLRPACRAGQRAHRLPCAGGKPGEPGMQSDPEDPAGQPRPVPCRSGGLRCGREPAG